LKLNGTHQLLVYADNFNILGGSVNTLQANAEALVVASKEIGLEVNADKTKCTVMSRDQNAGRSHDIKIGNSCLEKAERFRYLGTTYHSVQNTIYKTVHVKVLLTAGILCLLDRASS
jgi:hypothetical protein